MELTGPEARVLGCLLEKQRTTPDVYPLSLNGLVTACNQSTNRDPVVAYRDDDVEAALDGLRAKELVRRGVYPGSRVIKYRHCLDDALELDDGGLALLAVLLLRGPQTPGELKTRTERLHPFADLAAVEDGLGALAAHAPPLAARLPREAGRKEARWAPTTGRGADAAEPGRPEDAGTPEARPGSVAGPGREAGGATAAVGVGELEARVAALERAVEELRARLDG